MKKGEVVLLILFVLAIVGNMIRFAGSGIGLFAIAMILSAFYFLFGFAIFNGIGFRGIFKRVAYKDIGALKIIASVVLGFFMSHLTLGILFRYQLWEGGGLMLVSSLSFLGFVLIGAMVGFFTKKKDFYKRIIVRIVLLGGLGLISFMISPSKLVEIYYRDDPAFVELYKKHLADRQNEALYQEFQEARRIKFGRPEITDE